MLLIDCPYCGPRAEVEFRHAGEAHLKRPGPGCSEAEWADYLYMRQNARGVRAERWSHVRGCGQFFNALRHSTSNRILATYRRDAPPPEVTP